jgi:hypothetical protein
VLFFKSMSKYGISVHSLPWWRKLKALFLGFIWRHKSDGGSTLKQNTVIRVSRSFVLCISLVFGGKYMEYRIISSLQYSISIMNTFEVDPPSDSLHNAVVKPKNRTSVLVPFYCFCLRGHCNVDWRKGHEKMNIERLLEPICCEQIYISVYGSYGNRKPSRIQRELRSSHRANSC